jgi:hypothetical protein
VCGLRPMPSASFVPLYACTTGSVVVQLLVMFSSKVLLYVICTEGALPMLASCQSFAVSSINN